LIAPCSLLGYPVAVIKKKANKLKWKEGSKWNRDVYHKCDRRKNSEKYGEVCK
jgi:hypothetical protein